MYRHVHIQKFWWLSQGVQNYPRELIFLLGCFRRWCRKFYQGFVFFCLEIVDAGESWGADRPAREGKQLQFDMLCAPTLYLACFTYPSLCLFTWRAPSQRFCFQSYGAGNICIMYVHAHACTCVCAHTNTGTHTHTHAQTFSLSLSLSLSHTLTFLHTHRYSYRDAHTHTRPNTTVMILVQS